MPKSQVANVENYEFGAPLVEAQVLKFAVHQGGKAQLRFLAQESDNDITVSVQVSPDDSSWSDTTANDNGEAVVDEAIKRQTYLDYTVNLREGVDKYMRILASGAARGQMQMRQDCKMEAMAI